MNVLKALQRPRKTSDNKREDAKIDSESDQEDLIIEKLDDSSHENIHEDKDADKHKDKDEDDSEESDSDEDDSDEDDSEDDESDSHDSPFTCDGDDDVEIIHVKSPHTSSHKRKRAFLEKSTNNNRRVGKVPVWSCKKRVPNFNQLISYMERLGRREPLNFDGSPSQVIAATWDHYNTQLIDIQNKCHNSLILIKKQQQRMAQNYNKAQDLTSVVDFLYRMNAVSTKSSTRGLTYIRSDEVD